jgi:hypothetical protein
MLVDPPWLRAQDLHSCSRTNPRRPSPEEVQLGRFDVAAEVFVELRELPSHQTTRDRLGEAKQTGQHALGGELDSRAVRGCT